MNAKRYHLYSKDEFSQEHAGKVAGKDAIDDFTGWAPSDSALLPIWPIFSGKSYWYEGNWFKHFNYDQSSLELILKGNMRFKQKDETHIINPGQIYIIHHGVNSLLETGPAGYCEKLAMGIRGTALGLIMNVLGLSDVLSLPLPNPDVQIKQFNKIENLLAQKSVSDIPQISSLTYKLLVELSQLQPLSSLPLLVKKAIKIMESNLNKPISISKVASSIGTSSTHLNRLFKKHFEQTPKQYLTNLKMNTARQMLKHTNLTIKDISQQLGYQNQLYFSNDFKKHTAVSPSEFRKNKPCF